MPLVRIDLARGKPPKYRHAIADVIYTAMTGVLNVPEGDRFVAITEHDQADLVVSPEYLGIEHTADVVLIQIGVGKATGAPVFADHYVAWEGLEFCADLTAPGAVLEVLVPPGFFLDRRDVLPGLVVARTVSMMKSVEDAQPGLARGVEDFLHVGEAVVGYCDPFHAIPKTSALGDEVVVWVDHQERRDLSVV